MDISVVKDYLALLNMRQDYLVVKVECEICGSSDTSTLLTSIVGPKEELVEFPVVGCTNCGHIYQAFRFGKEFYQDYYDKFYRLNLFGDSSPDKNFLLDQVKRGELLYRNLADWLPDNGTLRL